MYVYNYNYIYIYPLFIVYCMYVYHVHILRMWSLGIYIYTCDIYIYIRIYVYIYMYWWVVSTPLKNMSSSVGIFIPNIWKVIKLMFQITNQYISIHKNTCIHPLFCTYRVFFSQGKWLSASPRLTLGRTRNWVRFCKLPQSHAARNRSSISGWWLTYPSEKWWTSSVMIFHSQYIRTVLGQS